MLAPVKPPVHVIVPVHPAKVNVVSAPAQILGLLAEAVKFNTTAELTVIVFSFDFGLSHVFVEQVAEYVVVVVGLTVTVVPVLPSDHLIVPVHPTADNVTLSPVQISFFVLEITGA